MKVTRLARVVRLMSALIVFVYLFYKFVQLDTLPKPSSARQNQYAPKISKKRAGIRSSCKVYALAAGSVKPSLPQTGFFQIKGRFLLHET